MNFLLLTATAMEMRAAIAALPCAGGDEYVQMSGQTPGQMSCRTPEQAVGQKQLVQDLGRPLLEQRNLSFADLPRLHLPGATLYLAVCGVGPVAAALSLGRVLGMAGTRPSLLHGALNLGIAGTYDVRVAPVGSVVLATGEAFPEYGIAMPEGVATEGFGFAQVTLASGPVYNSMPLDGEKALGNMGLNWHSPLVQGRGVTVAGVSGTPERALRLAARTGGLMENMEGFSLALGCAAAGLPFAEIRSISNEAGFRPPDRWNMPLALDALSGAVHALLRPFCRKPLHTAGKD